MTRHFSASRSRNRSAAATALAVTLAVGGGLLLPSSANAADAPSSPAPTPVHYIAAAKRADAITGSYIVVLKDGGMSVSSARTMGAAIANAQGARITHSFTHTIKGFAARMSAAAARKVAADPAVAYVEQNKTVHADATQSPTPSWGLDRIDQHSLPLDSSFTYPTTASNVTAYIVDTGILMSHSQFGGRAVSGTDTIDDDGNATDCNGHGTHVAGTVGGSTYGVAKGVKLVGVRVLDCAGEGTDASVIAGIDWVTADHVAGTPAVANMSLGGDFSQALNDAVQRAISDGVTFAVAAGNDSGANACNSSPASTPAALTVGATTSTDARSGFSNIGSCLDIFAPGSSITSSWYTSNTATNTISGTSMATPHVTGAAALILAANPSYTPAQVASAMVSAATTGVVTNPGTGSPNRLLYVGVAATPPPPPATTGCSATNGSKVSIPDITTVYSDIAVSGCPGSASAFSTVKVDIVHPYSGDLVISLVAPDGTAYVLQNRVGGSAHDIHSTFTVDLSSKAANGTWRLRVRDAASGDTGYIDNVVLNLSSTLGPPTTCTATNAGNVIIADNTTVSSAVTVGACPGTASATSTVKVDILHPYIGDLVVSLVAPDGSVYVLQNRSGGSAHDIHKTFTVNLSSEARNGTWQLRVQDAATGDTGYIDNVTLTL